MVAVSNLPEEPGIGDRESAVVVVVVVIDIAHHNHQSVIVLVVFLSFVESSGT